jgi:hypothetical protein
MSIIPLVSGRRNVHKIITRERKTLSHMKKYDGTLTSKAERTVARRPKVLARPKARPRI